MLVMLYILVVLDGSSRLSMSHIEVFLYCFPAGPHTSLYVG